MPVVVLGVVPAPTGLPTELKLDVPPLALRRCRPYLPHCLPMILHSLRRPEQMLSWFKRQRRSQRYHWDRLMTIFLFIR